MRCVNCIFKLLHYPRKYPHPTFQKVFALYILFFEPFGLWVSHMSLGSSMFHSFGSRYFPEMIWNVPHGIKCDNGCLGLEWTFPYSVFGLCVFFFVCLFVFFFSHQRWLLFLRWFWEGAISTNSLLLFRYDLRLYYKNISSWHCHLHCNISIDVGLHCDFLN